MPNRCKKAAKRIENALKISQIALSQGDEANISDMVEALRFKASSPPSSERYLSSGFYKVTLIEKQSGDGGNISLKVDFRDADEQRTVAAVRISDNLEIKSISSILELSDVRISELDLP